MKAHHFLVVILFFVTNTILAQVPTQNLLAYYTFTGNLNDVSGNGIHGTNYGATLTVDRSGSSDHAYRFSNTARVELNDDGKLNITSDLTIAAIARGPSLVDSFDIAGPTAAVTAVTC
jgi:hypothetical protein